MRRVPGRTTGKLAPREAYRREPLRDAPKELPQPRRHVEGGTVAGHIGHPQAEPGHEVRMSYASPHWRCSKRTGRSSHRMLIADPVYPRSRMPTGKTTGASHSSGIPALRSPAKYVVSNKARTFGTS
jgi:hypothetical protein